MSQADLITRYDALVQGLGQGYCVIEMLFDEVGRPVDYRFIEANQAFEAETGLAQAMGRTVREMLPAHESYWFELYGGVARTGQPISITQRAQALNRWYHVSAFRIGGDGSPLVGVLFSDVTERKRTEAALRQSEEREAYLLALSDALRSLTDPAAIQAVAARTLGERLGASRTLYGEVRTEPDGLYCIVKDHYCAPGVASLAGRYRVQDFGAALLGEMSTGATVAVNDIASEPSLSAQEQAAYPATGIQAYITVPLIKQGRCVALVSAHQARPRAWSAEEIELVEETAERTWADVERAQAEAALHASEQRLREADRRKDEFLATLAHELRNPLATIRPALHLLSNLPGDAAEVVRVHGMLKRQVDHMVRLIDDLMEVSRISRGAIELRREPLNLAAVVRDVTDAATQAIARARHTLSVEWPDGPLPVDGDPLRLGQILSNVLNNAVRYTDAGGRITVRAWREDGSARIAVSDTGIGIAASKLGSVFDMFGQIDRSDARSQGGLGIGLALAQRLARMHGGDIAVSSPGLGQGSTFTVSLPLAADLGSKAVPQTAEACHGALTARKVLVVDDNRDAADMTGLILGSLGAEVRVAHDGPAALDVLNHWPPDVALLDLGMPGMDGHELARHLRAHPHGAGLRLVALTGWGQQGDIERTRASGFDQHLVKPASAEQLLAVLRRPG